MKTKEKAAFGNSAFLVTFYMPHNIKLQMGFSFPNLISAWWDTLSIHSSLLVLAFTLYISILCLSFTRNSLFPFLVLLHDFLLFEMDH